MLEILKTKIHKEGSLKSIELQKVWAKLTYAHILVITNNEIN